MFVNHISPFSVHSPLSHALPLPICPTFHPSLPRFSLHVAAPPGFAPSSSPPLPPSLQPAVPSLGRAPAGNMLPVRDGPVKSALLSESVLFFCPGTNILFVLDHGANNTRDLFYCSHSKESLICRCIAEDLSDATRIKRIKRLDSLKCPYADPIGAVPYKSVRL